jgi:DNA replication protein DnaC
MVFSGPAGVIRLPCEPCSLRDLEERERAERDREAEGRLRAAGMAPLFEGWSLDTFPRDGGGAAALAKARVWLAVRPPRPNLLVFGDVGLGKTGLAWSLVRAMVERGERARLVSWLDYLAALKEAYALKERPERLDAVPVLFLDDLGAERPTPWALDELATLVERRHRHALTTGATSNFTPGELAAGLAEDEVLGRRIVSRLADGAQIRMEGRDRRLRG